MIRVRRDHRVAASDPPDSGWHDTAEPSRPAGVATAVSDTGDQALNSVVVTVTTVFFRLGGRGRSWYYSSRPGASDSESDVGPGPPAGAPWLGSGSDIIIGDLKPPPGHPGVNVTVTSWVTDDHIVT